MPKPRKRPWAVVRMAGWSVYFAATRESAERHAAKMNARAGAQEQAWALLNARPAYHVEYQP